jgi:protein phosphatase
VTIRALVFLVVLAAILVGGYSAVRWFDVNSYYVGLDGNELMIYQGRIGGVLWYHPVVVERTGVTTGNVLSDPLTVGALRSGVQEPSYAAARAYVSGLVRTDASTRAASAPGGEARAAPVALRTGLGTTLLGATGTDRLAISGGQ